MSVDDRLVEVLCCPVSRVAVRRLEPERCSRLNERVRRGEVRHVDGTAVEGTLEEALITEDGATIYPVVDGTPVMLAEKGIEANVVAGDR